MARSDWSVDAAPLAVGAAKGEGSGHRGRLKSDFVSAVSYEFRTPLATLRQLTENLPDGRVGDEDRRQAYYQAQPRATSCLSRLVERLLDFGRMETGALRYRPEPLDLAKLLRSVVDEFEHVVADTGHRIELKQ